MMAAPPFRVPYPPYTVRGCLGPETRRRTSLWNTGSFTLAREVSGAGGGGCCFCLTRSQGTTTRTLKGLMLQGGLQTLTSNGLRSC